MTLEKILHAAVNSMIKGHHAPHCFSAWVKDQGYVNKGDGSKFDRQDYLRQLEQTATSEIENMEFASDYAEPGYDKPTKGILFADWNCLPRNFDTILEKMGYAIEWTDEWAVCDCMKAFRLEADSFGWNPAYKEYNGELMCLECYKNKKES